MNSSALTELFRVALQSVNAGSAVRRHLVVEAEVLRLDNDVRIALRDYPKVLVIGAGKAAAGMAQAVEELLGARIRDGAIIVKYAHTQPLRIVRQYEAAHPVPDVAGVEATANTLALLDVADAKTLVIALLSGGGSSLLIAPAPGLTLADKQATTALLLRAGADIEEMNAVRKHLSAVKGGLLARRARPARVVGLAISDVPGDRLDVVASGPLTADGSTFDDALAVLHRYRLADAVPPGVLRHLQRGARGELDETPKKGDTCFDRTDVFVVAGIDQAIRAAGDQARQWGYRVEIIGDLIRDDVYTAAAMLARRARSIQDSLQRGDRVCLLSGGETTVTVRGQGLGGRNQEFALIFAREIQGCAGITLLSAGTDGTDGPTDAAGAIVDGNTWALASAMGVDAPLALDDNDSYHSFEMLDARTGLRHHIKTGPTGTNVMDLQLILIE